jgi:hypothetical protein
MNAGATPAQTVAPVARVGKFAGSVRITKEAWAILRKDKEILWFPVLSAITSAVALGIMALVYFFIIAGASLDGGLSHTASYALLFVYYLVTFFIVNFFEAGIMIIAHARMTGNNLSLKDGLGGAFRNIGKIFVWSLISATVGIILKAIANKKNILAKIVAGLLGAAWNIMTFFSLPALVISGSGIMQSFKDSAATIRKVWGETFIVSVGVGFIFGLIGFGGIIVAGIIMFTFPTATVFTVGVVLLVLFFVLLSIISSSLSSIFKVALYEYATTGRVPEGFSSDVITSIGK